MDMCAFGKATGLESEDLAGLACVSPIIRVPAVKV